MEDKIFKEKGRRYTEEDIAVNSQDLSRDCSMLGVSVCSVGRDRKCEWAAIDLTAPVKSLDDCCHHPNCHLVRAWARTAQLAKWLLNS